MIKRVVVGNSYFFIGQSKTFTIPPKYGLLGENIRMEKLGDFFGKISNFVGISSDFFLLNLWNLDILELLLVLPTVWIAKCK